MPLCGVGHRARESEFELYRAALPLHPHVSADEGSKGLAGGVGLSGDTRWHGGPPGKGAGTLVVALGWAAPGVPADRGPVAVLGTHGEGATQREPERPTCTILLGATQHASSA